MVAYTSWSTGESNENTETDMSGITKGIVGAIAIVPLALGMLQLASGQRLAGARQDWPDASETRVNRAAKADRVAGVVGSELQTNTVSIRFDDLATSVLANVRIANGTRRNSSTPASTDRENEKIGCEAFVSVLAEVSKQLQPGRCVT